jgi:acyl carrier protein
LDLDYLLLYSSFTTVFGNPGQYNYVAANGFMEGIARRLRLQGVPALAVSWGAIEDAGYLARNIETDPTLKKRFSSSLLPASTALDCLDWMCDRHGRFVTASAAIARSDWAAAQRDLAVLRAPQFGALPVAGGTDHVQRNAEIVERLKSMTVEEAAHELAEVVVAELARVLRMQPKELDRHRPLADIGMDSLMMLELRNSVESTLQVELPMMSLSSGITPVDVARRIAPLVTKVQQQPVSSTIATLSASHVSAEAEAATADQRRAAVAAVLDRMRELGNS